MRRVTPHRFAVVPAALALRARGTFDLHFQVGQQRADRVRAEVATAYARTHARFAEIQTAERAVESSRNGFQEDLRRTYNQEGLPIEVLDSMRLLARSRTAYLDAICDYNRAQFELYVALGQPPADTLARPVPADLVPPPGK